VILAGALILWRAMEMLNFSELRVSTRGLRYGVLI
jgi:exopolyphosphatase/pppGpp-phosphohydrolase